jgi:hypothetical protein
MSKSFNYSFNMYFHNIFKLNMPTEPEVFEDYMPMIFFDNEDGKPYLSFALEQKQGQTYISMAPEVNRVDLDESLIKVNLNKFLKANPDKDITKLIFNCYSEVIGYKEKGSSEYIYYHMEHKEVMRLTPLNLSSAIRDLKKKKTSGNQNDKITWSFKSIHSSPGHYLHDLFTVCLQHHLSEQTRMYGISNEPITLYGFLLEYMKLAFISGIKIEELSYTTIRNFFNKLVDYKISLPSPKNHVDTEIFSRITSFYQHLGDTIWGTLEDEKSGRNDHYFEAADLFDFGIQEWHLTLAQENGGVLNFDIRRPFWVNTELFTFTDDDVYTVKIVNNQLEIQFLKTGDVKNDNLQDIADYFAEEYEINTLAKVR